MQLTNQNSIVRVFENPNTRYPYLFDVKYECDEGWNEKNQAVGQVTHLSVKPNCCEVQETFSANA